MDSGQLKDRIYIYELEITRSPYGNTNRKWVCKYSTRARVNYSSGTRGELNDELFYTVEREFIVRHYVPVVDTDIIVWNNEKWRIISIDRNRQYNNIFIRTTKIMDEDIEIDNYDII